MKPEQIQFLIDNLQEGLDVEVKNWLGGLADYDSKAKLAKEIIALANNGGGFVFIGFNDDQDHTEIEPEEGQLEAFSQDNIASIVQRYVEPPCQCQVAYIAREGSQLRHPVILVPGGHRTPLWARRASPDGQSLQSGMVYVRRPGGGSEPARTQDDWEKFIERLVKARQDEQLTAIRKIFNPQEDIDLGAKPDLDAWDDESYRAWQAKLADLPADSPHRLSAGHWSCSFLIDPFEPPPLNELNRVLEHEMPRYSGWRPFTYLHGADRRPVARGDVIEAWLCDRERDDPSRSDYWRVSRDGRGYLLRPMQEDDPNFLANRHPGPELPAFDWLLPIYRVTELLKFAEALALRFSDGNAQLSVLLRYYGCDGRKLCCSDFGLQLLEGARCAQPTISSRMTLPVEELRINLEERVHTLLVPIFEQFEFAELPKPVVDRQVRRVLNFPNN